MLKLKCEKQQTDKSPGPCRCDYRSADKYAHKHLHAHGATGQSMQARLTLIQETNWVQRCVQVPTQMILDLSSKLGSNG